MTAPLTPLQQAFHVIRDLEAKLDEASARAREPIAVLGSACRLPGGVTSPEELWQLLAEGRDATSCVPAERFDVDGFYDPDPRAVDKTLTRRAGMLDEIDRFDARFFGISPREATALDPQQRLLLECTWEALERAGIPPHLLEGSATGVFVAAGPSDYLHRHAYAGGPKEMEVYDGTGNAGCFAAGRIAYLLGTQGPCFTVDTACSSSLLAFHLACQSLRAGECELAIVAGVNLIVSPETFLFLSRAGNISADGRSRTFDAAASGYGRGEGCGVVVLRRLARARQDGDPVLAVVRGSAVNHDGAKSGLTVPSGLAQQAVIRRACELAGVAPRQLGYVEAHGTATLLGDPIELEALGEVVAGRSADQPLWIGSIKSNVGHLEAAAGIAGLLKVVLMLQHRRIPASLHFTRPNPHADWARLPLRVATSLVEWQVEGPRIAGLSSFGLSGTNVHVVLEEAPPPPTAPAAPTSIAEPLALLLSARSPAALRQLAVRYRRLLDAPAFRDEAARRQLAHTAARRRSHYPHRLAISGGARDAWLDALGAFANDAAHADAVAGHVASEAAPLAFVVSGQGSQWLGMGRSLFAKSEAFRQAVREASEALAAHGAPPLDHIAGAISGTGAEPDLSDGEIVQPLLFAMHVALARQWQSWGVTPAMITGHSVGEAAAAHLAGALSLDDAARVVAVRSRLLGRLRHQGGMSLVELSEDELAPYLARFPALGLGGRNAPRTSVVSGALPSLEQLERELTAAKVFVRRVKIDVASHSPQVEPLLDELRAQLAALRPTAARLPLFSTVTGARIDGATLDADYWAENLRQPVRLADAVSAMAASGAGTFLEIGPHPVLAVALRQTLGAERRVLASLRRGREDVEALTDSVAALYAAGHPLELARLWPTAQPVADAPTYPWQRERYWIPLTRRRAAANHPTAGATSLAGRRIASPGEELHFQDEVSTAAHPYLADHRVFGDVVVPGAFHLAAVLAAAPELVGSQACQLDGVAFAQALVLREGATIDAASEGTTDAASVDVHLTAQPRPDGARKLRRASAAAAATAAGGPWIDHLTATIRPLPSAQQDEPTAAWDGAAATSRATQERSPAAFYQRNTSRGIELDARFQWIAALRTTAETAAETAAAEATTAEAVAVAELVQPAALDERGAAPVHPAQLDAVFQTIAATLACDATADRDDAFIPFSVERLRVRAALPGRCRCVARSYPEPSGDPAFLLGDAVVLDEQGRELLRVDGLRLRRVSAAALAPATAATALPGFYESRWQRQALPAAAELPRGTRWLFLADDEGVAEALAARLRERGDVCTSVSRARTSPSDGDALAEALATEHDELVFLWSTAPSPSAASVFELVQVLAALQGRPRVSVITRGAQRVSPPDTDGAPGAPGADAGEPPLDLSASLFWGLARALRHERPAFGLSRFDISAGTSSAAALVAELLLRQREEEVVLRPRGRFVGRLAPRKLAASAALAPLSADASYLLTGGLGGLGLRVAEHLVARGARALVLVGRRASEDALDEGQRAALARLRAAGARVALFAADVAERDELAAALAAASALAPLRGVVHAAGLVDDAVLEHQSLAKLERVLAPKARAALHLHELTRALPLDFFVLFSSAASVIGAPGQSNYAAANAFLDALALARRGEGLPALSLSWGAFSEVGMAAAQENRGARVSHHGLRSLSPAEGLRALDALLAAGARAPAHLTVLHLDAHKWQQALPHLAGLPRFAALAPASVGASTGASAPAASSVETLRALPPKQRREAITRALRKEIGLVLRLDASSIESSIESAIDPLTPLMSLGFDSLLSLELRNRLESAFSLSLSAVLLWTYPTLTALAEHLDEQLAPPAAASAPAEAAAPSRNGAAGATETDAAADAADDAALDALSEAEQEALLEAKLAKLARVL